MALTNVELLTDIADLTERVRAIRIEQGLPADPLPRPLIVGLPLTGAIIKRVEPFKAIAVKLATILAQGQTARIDTGKLRQYREYERLLEYSYGTWGGFYAIGIRIVFGIIERINNAIDEGEAGEFDTNAAMRRVHFAISTFLKERSISGDMYEAYGGYNDERRAAEAEMSRLITDDKAFQAAYDEALAQLPTKEEDDLYE